MEVDSRRAQRIVDRCREIAAFSEVRGETTRLYLCEPMRAVHGLLRGWMEVAGMTVTVDAAGNLRGLFDPAGISGAGGSAGRLMVGSHLDTVPRAGAFDGVLGVVMGVALVEEMARAGVRPGFAVEVVGFSEEEGVRFGMPFLGSLAMVGGLTKEVLERRDARGVSVAEALGAFGCDSAGIPGIAGEMDGVMGYLEVHIEQGPVLESEGRGVGVVDALVGQTRLRVTFTGEANHAGTTPMRLRRDAMTAAAEWVGAVEEVGLRVPGLVATVGRMEARPGAVNVVAGEVVATLDARHAEDGVRTEAVREMRERAEAAGARRGVRVSVEVGMEQAAVRMDQRMVRALTAAAGRVLGGDRDVRVMMSGAGHDAMVMAGRVPSAMLFLRSPGGLSHHPEETVLVEDVETGLAVMAEFVMAMAAGGR